MKILRVKKTPFYDVFIGSGWKGHTRVLVKGSRVQHNAGRPLKKIQYVEIAKTVGVLK